MTASKCMCSIITVDDHPTINFAAQELQHYLGRMIGSEVKTDKGNPDAAGIKVGLMSSFPTVKVPDVPDPYMDDAVFVEVRDGKGIIAGNNPRSVMLAVYRYLTELGCSWVRPGKDGEYIPSKDNLPAVKVEETASCRHRGICIEGAVSVEHVCDIIDWMSKVGFNAYFTQFREAHTFFARWYAHQGNPCLEGRMISVEEAREFTAQAVEEIEKRNLIYHAVGHGWTCEPFGISGLGWDTFDQQLTDEISQYLAEVNGERKFWGGVPLNTNLCYGNPEVRKIITDEIADYAEKHPEVDVLHFWLADGSNNNCECELCRDTRPSDFFVQMLNSLDEKMSAKSLKTRVVMLIYVDLLWPAVKEKIKNPDRFILMFAPITRTYSSSFSVSDSLPELSPFERNKLKFPSSVEENVAFLRAWQKDFNGDSFDFDYHLMWDHFKDPGYMPASEIMYKDMKGLKDIGLNGNVSCQVQRAFFPTGLMMTVMGETLWNRNINYESLANDYFNAAFGPDGALCKQYLEKISDLFDPVYIRGEKPAVSTEAADKFAKIPGVIDEFLPVIERNMSVTNDCWSRSWFYMKHHAEICRMLADAFEARSKDDKKLASERWEKVKQYINEKEMELHPVLDAMTFKGVLGGNFT